jgi:serine phosphatase RsbU (regulator of sigma subunit)
MEQYVSRLNLVALVTSNESLRSFLSQVEFFSTDQWIVDILESSYPLIHDNLTGIDPFGKLFSYGENYSAIISPLRVGLQPLGILVLSHPQPSRYGDEAQLIMSTFASYASVAIKNTQLYAAAHDQAWVSTVLLQVAEATQSINSLDELIHTVVHVIPQLVGVEACGILLWDRKIGSFTPYESFGLTPKQQDYFELWNFKENENPVFDHLLNSKEPVIMTQAMIGESQAKHLFSPFNLDREIFALFPMISQTDIQGAIIIDFSENISEYDYKLWEEKFLIIQGIAHQTAVAVENIKLIQSQEEEAYVSIALLQVAQAIVSANEIDDVLSVVVRITPILVAVKRCVIFLWDFTRNGFVLSQSYGISRSELSLVPKLLLPDSFPLLNEVRHRIQIACHLIKSDIFAFSEWSDLIIDDLLFLGNASQDRDDSTSLMTREVLSSKQGLLFAYPLAVKGVVYGIMVTEEELSERGTPSYHIRERRMEIITGITQQTALALQNDILQIEALIRERLDRELQLAREIQSNFMPEHLPYLPGWELNVKWKPARQVGGDYYDVIELPNGDIGLVIADVADKGMPAALFMTLVRTLLRATSRENKSPSRALKEINDLLVPDAKNGMFVTLFYGILNPDNGKFIYANAGHVPPILVSNNGTELIDLVPSGMALGVLPGISMEEKQLQLLPGDKLICYTDGVSEAFSAGGEMYGTFRLKNLISIESNKLSTSELLEAIVNEVYRFSDSSSLSDDLTLIAVCRKLLTQIEN